MKIEESSLKTWTKKGSNKEFAKPEEQLITIDRKEMRRSYSKMENFFIVLQRPELNLKHRVTFHKCAKAEPTMSQYEVTRQSPSNFCSRGNLSRSRGSLRDNFAHQRQ